MRHLNLVQRAFLVLASLVALPFSLLLHRLLFERWLPSHVATWWLLLLLLYSTLVPLIWFALDRVLLQPQWRRPKAPEHSTIALSHVRIKLYHQDLEATDASSHHKSTDKGTIVFSHGLQWSHRMFEWQMRELSRAGYRCIAFDHRGQGLSPRSPDARDYTIDDLTVDAVVLLHQLDVAPVHWIGLSMGGFVGLRLALRYPKLLASLILIDSTADAEPILNHFKYGAMALVVLTFGTSSMTEAIMNILFGDSFLRDRSRVKEAAEYRRRLEANDVPGTLAALEAVVARPSIVDELRVWSATSSLPMLFLHGAEDKAISVERAQLTAQALGKHCTFRLLPGAGHSSSMETPELVTKEIMDFLRREGGQK